MGRFCVFKATLLPPKYAHPNGLQLPWNLFQISLILIFLVFNGFVFGIVLPSFRFGLFKIFAIVLFSLIDFLNILCWFLVSLSDPIDDRILQKVSSFFISANKL